MSTPAYHEKRISTHRLLPLVICFHGSGETCIPSWNDLAAQLVTESGCRVLLYDRGPGNLKADVVAREMWDFVVSGGADESGDGGNELRGPWLLIAHSYGGAFSRAFVQVEGQPAQPRVMGLVLVETGQEGGLDDGVDDSQVNSMIMGERPVCVVRGNSLIGKWKELGDRERALASAGSEYGGRDALVALREMLERMDKEDERLKKRQLGLSRKSRFVNLPDVGHHVVRDRPDVVVECVRWVLENGGTDERENKGRFTARRIFERLRKGFG
ncbi:Alpha/Beta hydrolase protein [Xylariaceae sp. FL1272]|nr:Alpha/Beta hydrolase protein [Xylariaceae sp. FL1272]